MPTQDQARIVKDRANPRPMALWWALRPLVSVVRFMQTGAHPDDEISGMLAALAIRDGINISYACSTRGEGGQNDIGTETGPDLGALRTREMERACDVLGMRMYWHSTHPEDTITDFGFSKSGTETLDRWGRERTMQRFVEIIRTEKPDVICPTFLDVPGQHGHHRAMTEAAHAVMSAAADPAFQSNLKPWQVKKLYLPAWSGAGQSYDDDLPPPPATMTIPGRDREAMTGWSWNKIGQQSRAFHRTQGMGRWVPAGEGNDWPLHLVETTVSGPDDTICSGLPRTVGDLAALTGAKDIAAFLLAAQAAIDATVQAFPNFALLVEHAVEAVRHIRQALANCPAQLADDIGHRLVTKEAQLGNVIRIGLGIEARAYTRSSYLDVGGSIEVKTELDPGSSSAVSAELDLPLGWNHVEGHLNLSEDAAVTDAYRAVYDPIAPDLPRINLKVTQNETEVVIPVAFDTEPVILPKERVVLTPSKAFLNTAQPNRSIMVAVSDLSPRDARLDLVLPDGWTCEPIDIGFCIFAPDDVAPGHYLIRALVNGKPADSVRTIDFDHVSPTYCAVAANITVGVFDVALPDVKVGYIGGGNDRVGDWLASMGLDVTPLTDSQLDSDSALSEFDSIVVGIFAMRFRSGLIDSMPRLHRWTEAGGNLVTLYHRPWDNWDPEIAPPLRLEIGQPSLRWRVTNEAAEVTHLSEHPILSTPNRIRKADWDGWAKERGLYFAKSWDQAYDPLLSMADPGEEPLTGALLVAEVGAGRHIHTSLILHHQMEHLVPGAFRLLANFVAPPR